jgi:acyl dehydratase
LPDYGVVEVSTFEETELGDTHRTAARTIAEADLVNFAGVSGDFNDLHLDAEEMADSEYGERIAQGALVFSVATGLLWQSRSDDDLVAFYGVDRLRFRAPVFVGDTIHVETEVLEKEPRDRPDAEGVIRHGCEVKNNEGETVLSAELIGLYR